MKAFKGFDKDMKCRGFQFEEGKTYEEKTADLCNSGFHACVAPLDVFKFYSPASSIFREVELDDVSPQRSDEDSKVCARKIKIGGKLDILGLAKAHFEYTKANTTMEHTDPQAATAGSFGAATSRGKTSVGENGIGLARGNDVMVKGGIGAILLIAEEERESYEVSSWKSFIVDWEEIKANTWYQLKGGVLVEAKENTNE